MSSAVRQLDFILSGSVDVVREEAQGRQHWGIFRDHLEMIPHGNIAVRQQVTRKMNKQSGVKIEKKYFFSWSLVVTGGTAGGSHSVEWLVIFVMGFCKKMYKIY